MAYDFKNEEDVKEFLQNLGIEYRFSCYHEKKPDGCHLLGDYLETIKTDYKKAATVYKANCDKYNFSKSCFKYGNYRFLGKGTTESKEVAYQYYEKGCKFGCSSSCLHCGLMRTGPDFKEIIPRDDKLGLKFYDRGCSLDDAECCALASSFYIFGTGVQKDMEKAFKYSLKACNMEHGQACANVSQMYRKGEGVPQNEELANKYKLKAIDIQDQHIKQQQTLEFGLGT